METIESECERHGLDLHVRVHEAAHAIAAVDSGIPFKQITIYSEGGGPTFDRGLWQAAAAVEMLSDDASSWVLPNPVAALHFVLAGSLAEIAVLGHAIDGGFRGDVRAWRKGLSRLDAIPAAELDTLAGGSFMTVKHETQNWADANVNRISRLASHLTTLPVPAVMPHQEVVSFLAG